MVRHPLEVPELTLRRGFFPLGFPVELRTNRVEVMRVAEEAWGVFEERFDTEAIAVDVHVTESETKECPPGPTYSIVQPLVVSFADAQNYCIADLSRGRTQMVVSEAALRHELYFRYFFLESAAASHIATSFTTPVHGACVALNGRGVLLCGESGAGKSTLAYACARAGWQYVTDDASLVLHDTPTLTAIGNCHQVRLRPSAAEIFPEIQGIEMTPRAAGKPSIELPTAGRAGFVQAESAEVRALVFLNRKDEGEPRLVRYPKDHAWRYLRGTLFGPPEAVAVQSRTIDRLLSVDVLEMRYTELDWAMERLGTLLEEGQ
jgi:hypothetical protein